jgi:hypothetical protein
MSTLTVADIAWHMRLHATGLGHEWVTPNALFYAWESDLLTVTPEGHVCEVEIKISRSDLRHDLLKPKHSQGLLLNGAPPDAPGPARFQRPNYFCFAMPCRVYRSTPPVALPRYAGIYTVDDEGRVFEERPPIQLHAERIRPDELLALARRMHHRYWDELRRARHAPGTGEEE